MSPGHDIHTGLVQEQSGMCIHTGRMQKQSGMPGRQSQGVQGRLVCYMLANGGTTIFKR